MFDRQPRRVTLRRPLSIGMQPCVMLHRLPVRAEHDVP
jgi:hypothetical protein